MRLRLPFVQNRTIPGREYDTPDSRDARQVARRVRRIDLLIRKIAGLRHVRCAAEDLRPAVVVSTGSSVPVTAASPKNRANPHWRPVGALASGRAAGRNRGTQIMARRMYRNKPIIRNYAFLYYFCLMVYLSFFDQVQASEAAYATPLLRSSDTPQFLPFSAR